MFRVQDISTCCNCHGICIHSCRKCLAPSEGADNSWLRFFANRGCPVGWCAGLSDFCNQRISVKVLRASEAWDLKPRTIEVELCKGLRQRPPRRFAVHPSSLTDQPSQGHAARSRCTCALLTIVVTYVAVSADERLDLLQAEAQQSA